jgi:glycosyltransferase involved in cell wall biosynthesis
MKVLFLNGDYPFCYYVRGYLPGVYSNQLVVSDFMRRDMKVDPAVYTKLADQADVVVFQRPNKAEYLQVAILLKKKGKKIIFENDDTYKGIPLERLENEKQIEIAKEQAQTIDSFLEIADGVIASTEILGKEYAQVNPNVAVLKNCIDPLDELPCKKNLSGKFRVGILGSVTSNDDYVHIKDQLRKLDARGDITFVIMGVKHKDGTYMKSMKEDFDFWSSLKNIEWHPYCHVTEYMSKVADMALDVAIIPRKEHYFNQCKSNLKFLEMSLLGIPVIAQGFSDGTSPYQGVDEPYMTIVVDNATWHDKILDVLYRHDYYVSLAMKAHDYVILNYSIKKYAKTWITTIKKLCKSK